MWQVAPVGQVLQLPLQPSAAAPAYMRGITSPARTHAAARALPATSADDPGCSMAYREAAAISSLGSRL